MIVPSLFTTIGSTTPHRSRLRLNAPICDFEMVRGFLGSGRSSSNFISLIFIRPPNRRYDVGFMGEAGCHPTIHPAESRRFGVDVAASRRFASRSHSMTQFLL